MEKLNYTWKQKTGQYQNGFSLYLNKICVAGYDWNVMRNRDKPDESTTYEGRIYLPGLDTKHFYGNDTEELKIRIQLAINAWFAEALK